MKALNLFIFAAVATALVSFNLNDKNEVKKHQNVTTLDATNSTLGWKGGSSATNFHVGTLKFKDGSVAMEHGAMVSGVFNIDLATITCTDAGMPKEKQEGLVKHLKNEDFFNVAKFAAVKVTTGSYKDGKLATTINVMGVDIQQEIPVTIVETDKGTKITGKFDVDFAAAKIPGTQAHEGDKETISSVFSFDLNLVLKSH